MTLEVVPERVKRQRHVAGKCRELVSATGAEKLAHVVAVGEFLIFEPIVHGNGNVSQPDSNTPVSIGELGRCEWATAALACLPCRKAKAARR